MSSHNKKVKLRDRKATYFLTILKYIYALFFPSMAVALNNCDISFLILAVSEVFFIALITNVLLRKKYAFGYAFNCISLFFINVQFGFLFWGNSFISLNMLENTDSLQDLGGKFIYYGITLVFLLICTFLPIKRFKIPALGEISLGLVVVLLYVFIFCTGKINCSPVYNMYDLIRQQATRRNINNLVKDLDTSKNEFLKTSVNDYIKKPDEISDNPNVILIFTEGLSENVVEDSRGITTNIKELEQNSISFKNYYNHTFATYMALSGQLYSGYQQDNYDANCLTSLQEIFKQYGYDTTMINTEPNNKEFSDYLETFNFDNVISDNANIDGMANSMSDKSTYEYILKTAEEKSKSDKPFFISTYTFGTHTTLDGVYNKYKDGSSVFLNRFYDLDIQLGKFVKAFKESELFENTVLIFTADHCSYQDADFSLAYPNYKRASTIVDRIPFLIYYKGVTPTVYDANGKNSLDMAPTVLDFLDMTGENSFLGDSLFAFDKSDSEYDNIFQSYANYYYTNDSKIVPFTASDNSWFELQLVKYFAIKLNNQSILNDYNESCHAYASLTKDNKTLNLEVTNSPKSSGINIAVWSEESNQADIKWFTLKYKKGESTTYSVDFSSFTNKGTYLADIYSVDSNGNQKRLCGTSFVSQ